MNKAKSEQASSSNNECRSRTSTDTEKTKVEGARRVWGTLREATVRSVKVTLNKVLTLEDSDGISVRRKYKHGTHGRKARWWFVLHGSESALASIEQKWESMSLQTGWKIEPRTRLCRLGLGSVLQQ